MNGRKADGLRFDLIPEDALAELAWVYTAGAQKYEDRNWEKGYEWHKSIRALYSHLGFFMAGEDRDPETGALHIMQVAWHAIALAVFYLRDVGLDDRPKNQHALAALRSARNRPLPGIKKFVPSPEDMDAFMAMNPGKIKIIKPRVPISAEVKELLAGIQADIDATLDKS